MPHDLPDDPRFEISGDSKILGNLGQVLDGTGVGVHAAGEIEAIL